jgi:hypothetical protein
MNETTPQKTAATPPTPENVAELLTSGDNDYHDDFRWKPSLYADGNVLHVEITPYADEGTQLPKVHLRAVVVEGEQTPIVLPRPAEPGIQWAFEGPMLELTEDDIILSPPGSGVWVMDPELARELAAHLAAMADALEAAQAEQDGAR